MSLCYKITLNNNFLYVCYRQSIPFDRGLIHKKTFYDYATHILDQIIIVNTPEM